MSHRPRQTASVSNWNLVETNGYCANRICSFGIKIIFSNSKYYVNCIQTMIRAKQTAELVLAEMGENVSPDKISFTDLLCEGAPYMIEPVGHNKQYLSEKYARIG